MCWLQTETVNAAQWNKSIFRALRKREREREKGAGGRSAAESNRVDSECGSERRRGDGRSEQVK